MVAPDTTQKSQLGMSPPGHNGSACATIPSMARERYANAHDIAEVRAGKGSASDKREVRNFLGGAAKKHNPRPPRTKRRRLR